MDIMDFYEKNYAFATVQTTLSCMGELVLLQMQNTGFVPQATFTCNVNSDVIFGHVFFVAFAKKIFTMFGCNPGSNTCLFVLLPC